MKIKETLVETKDKAKAWCERHKRDIRDFAWYCGGVLVGGTLYYHYGKKVGRDAFAAGLVNSFDENHGEINSITNADTKKVDGIVSSKLLAALLKSPDIKAYDDGTFDYLDEISE